MIRLQIGNLVLADRTHDVRGLANPYLGLAAFTYDERTLYAGREQAITEALEKLTAPASQRVLLFITGASGSGKSSFAQAGLVPALERHYTPGIQLRIVDGLRPSQRPLERLIDALQRRAGLPMHRLDRSTLPHSLYTLLVSHTDTQQVNIVVLDQFEELFTQSDPAQRDALLAILANLPPFHALRTHILVTVRADYLPELFQHQSLYAQVKAGVELRAMVEAELREAIQRPLQRHPQARDKRFATGLLDALAGDAARSVTYLPLLQLTIYDLWTRGLLVREAYGSLTDSIGRHAEQLYAVDRAGQERIERERQQLLQIFLDLVEVSLDDDVRRDVRRRRTLAELTQADPDHKQLIDELVTARLLSQSLEQHDGREVEVVDIIHESLIGNWERLSQAITGRRSRLQQRARFEIALGEWQQQRTDEYLLDGVRFSEAQALEHAGDVALRSPAAQAFLRQSVARRERVYQTELRRQTELAEAQRRRASLFRQAFGAVVLLLLVALGATTFAFERQQEAERQRKVAQANASEAERQRKAAADQAALARSRQLASEARVRADDQLDQALLLGLEAATITDTLEARSTLPAVLQSSPDVSAYLRAHGATVRSVAFSPDGEMLATGGDDDVIRLWDVASDQRVGAPLRGHTGNVASVAFSPDGSLLASTGLDRTIILWDLVSSERLALLQTEHEEVVWSVAFSPDGSLLAVGSQDGSISFWDVAARTQKGERQEIHTGGIYSVAFSPDGALLATGDGDNGAIVFWDVEAGQIARRLDGTNSVYQLAFSPDGTLLAIGSFGGKIVLWNLAAGTIAREISFPNGLGSIAFSPDGARIASGSKDGPIRFWSVADGQSAGETLSAHTHGITDLAFSPDGSRLASASQDATAILWHQGQGTRLGKPLLKHPDEVFDVAVQPNSNIIVFGSRDGTIIRYDTASQEQVGAPLEAEIDGIWSVEFSSDGRLLAAGGSNGAIALWDATTWERIGRFEAHTARVMDVTFSPEGDVLVSAGADNNLRRWDVTSRQPIGGLLEGHTNEIRDVVFSSDGKRLISVGLDAMRVWNAETGAPLEAALDGPDRNVFTGLAISDDKRLAASSSSEGVVLWELNATPIGGTPIPLTAGASEVAFAASGRMLFVGLENGSVLLVDIASHQVYAQLEGLHQHPIWGFAVSPQNDTLITASSDGQFARWSTDEQAWRDLACAIADRNLSWDEWRRFLADEMYRATCDAVALRPSDAAQQAGLLAQEADRAGLLIYIESLASQEQPALHYRVCRASTRPGMADLAIPACERALKLSPEWGFYHDSRGVARALAGDVNGAIEDFRAFVMWTQETDRYERYGSRREEWIAALSAGADPFDETTLTELQGQ